MVGWVIPNTFLGYDSTGPFDKGKYMDNLKFALLPLFAVIIAACGGGEFYAAQSTGQDAEVSETSQPEAGQDSKADAGDADAVEEAAIDSPAETAIEAAADGPLAEASEEAGEDAGEDVTVDAVEDQAVVEATTDAIEPEDVVQVDADPCPNGGILDTGPEDCGQVPSSGLWICVIVPHIKTCGTVGIAGSNPPLGLLVDTYWNDPMIVTGGPCIAPSNSEDSILCKLQAPSLTTVQFVPGLHNGSGPTIPDRFACDSQGCRGRVHVYKDGNEVGGMQNSTASGIVSLVQHQGRKDLAFTAP